MPFEGRNPNRAAAAVIAALSELEQSLQQRHGTHEHLGQPWVTPTVLRAGEPVQMNVMPEQASLWVDVRTIPTIEHERAARRRHGAGRGCRRTVRGDGIDHGDRRPAGRRGRARIPARAGGLGCPRRGRHLGAPARRRAGHDRRHDAERPRRRPDRRLRPGRQVDRPSGRRVRRGVRHRRARQRLRRGGAPVPRRRPGR